MTLVPALVWSRLYAYGGYQAFEGIYVAGEYGVNSPKLPSVLLGTQGLAALGNRDYAFFWSSRQGSNRPQSPPLFGTDGSAATGTVGRPIFTSPTDDGQFSENFSMAYTPSGDTTFGTTTPIENGTGYRFNWEIVSAPFASIDGNANEEQRNEIRAKRRKIAGSQADGLANPDSPERGQPGEGREYSRHMGFIQLGNQQFNDRTIRPVNVGDLAVFEIDNRDDEWEKLQDDPDQGFKGTEVNLQDLINSAKSWRSRASDLLVVGSRWICGACSWVVVQRGETSNKQQIFVDMRCVAILGTADIGIPGTRTVREPLAGFDGRDIGTAKRIGANFFTLCGLKIATIRPTRRDADAIYIGIRSRVYNRANGLCNFNDIPSPNKIFKLDEKNVQVQSGKMNKYFRRSSCFSIWVRPILGAQSIGSNAGANDLEDFVPIPKVFCVQGDSPIFQNNFIRIRPRTKGLYEYRLIPRTGTDIQVNGVPGDTVIVLDSNEGIPYTTDGLQAGIGKDYPTRYGNFRITTQGREVPRQNILANEELFSNPTATQSPVAQSLGGAKPAGLVEIGRRSDTGFQNFDKAAFYYDILGNPASSRNRNKEVRVTKRFFKRGAGVGDPTNPSRFINFTIVGESKNRRTGLYVQALGSGYEWDVRYEVDPNDPASTDGWGIKTQNDRFELDEGISSSNPFRQFANSRGEGYSRIIFTYQVIAGTPTPQVTQISGDRKFELYSQVADTSHSLELAKSNNSWPEHEVNEYIENYSKALYE